VPDGALQATPDGISLARSTLSTTSPGTHPRARNAPDTPFVRRAVDCAFWHFAALIGRFCRVSWKPYRQLQRSILMKKMSALLSLYEVKN